MRWQGSVNFPTELSYVVSIQQMQALDGIFYTSKSNSGIYILKAASTATPINEIIIQVGGEFMPLNAPGRFVKVNDVFIHSLNEIPEAAEIPEEISMGIIKGNGNGIFLKINGQIIQIGQWPVQ